MRKNMIHKHAKPLFCCTLLLSTPLCAMELDISHSQASRKYERSMTALAEISEKREHAIRAVSYNVAADFFDKNDTTTDKRHYWQYRAPFVKKLLQNINADIMCLQELSPNQAIELAADLASFGYSARFLCQIPSEIEAGTIADEEQVKAWKGKNCGTPLIGTFINQDWKIVEAGRFWLNEAPHALPHQTDRGETDKGFGNKNTYRAVLWTKIENAAQKNLFIFNSHYPLSGNNQARLKCAQLERDQIDQIAKNSPWISMGDRNIIPVSQDSGSHNPETVYQALIKAAHDSRNGQQHYGISTSWLGFSYDKHQNGLAPQTGDFKELSMLDIMVSNLKPAVSFCHHGAIDPQKKTLWPLSEKLTEQQDTQRYFSSDHALVGADFLFHDAQSDK